MHVTARRIRGGQALKAAIAGYGDGQGITLKALHQRTVQLDPAGKGVSLSMIGFLTAPAAPAGPGRARTRRFRETTSTNTAWLLELALDARPGELFTREQVRDPGDPEDNPGPPAEVLHVPFRAAG